MATRRTIEVRAGADEASRGRGRPAIGDRMECRFPPDQRSEIDRLAEQWDVRPPEVVRRLVELGLSALRHDPPAK